jgi:hypothetical protein
MHLSICVFGRSGIWTESGGIDGVGKNGTGLLLRRAWKSWRKWAAFADLSRRNSSGANGFRQGLSKLSPSSSSLDGARRNCGYPGAGTRNCDRMIDGERDCRHRMTTSKSREPIAPLYQQRLRLFQ